MPKYKKEEGDPEMRGQRKRRKLQLARRARRAKRLRVAVITISTVLIMAAIIDEVRLLMTTLESSAEVETSEADVVTDDTVAAETVTRQEETCVVESRLESEPVVEDELSELARMMAAEYYENLDDASERLVLVDIFKQHIWAFEGEEVVLESPVVTGLKDRYDTQLGKYSVILKKQNYTMRGSYGRVRVGYWMRFNDAYAQGLHDATWRSDATFGGDTYISNGSHGCVNLPLEFTAELYDFVEVGTPVIVQE